MGGIAFIEPDQRARRDVGEHVRIGGRVGPKSRQGIVMTKKRRSVVHQPSRLDSRMRFVECDDGNGVTPESAAHAQRVPA